MAEDYLIFLLLIFCMLWHPQRRFACKLDALDLDFLTVTPALIDHKDRDPKIKEMFIKEKVAL
jgi:hypothetical protein